MSFSPNKATLLVAIMTLITATTISVSAQTPAAVNGLSTKPDSIREARETDAETRSGPDAEGTAETGAGSEVKRGSEVSDSVAAYAGTKVNAGAADAGLAATTMSSNAIPQSASTEGWQFQLTPYLWIPTISGRSGIGNFMTDSSTTVTDSGIELNFAIMGTFEARKGRFIILTDLQYSDLATERGNPGPLFSSTRASFKTLVFDSQGGFRIFDNNKGAIVDVLGGIRYWNIDATLAFGAGIAPAVEVSRSRSWIDGVASLRGKAPLSERWFLTGKAGLGGGGSNFTYQLFGGVGYNIGPRVALIGGYRDLSVNYNKDGFLFDMSLHGPIFGIGFKF